MKYAWLALIVFCAVISEIRVQRAAEQHPQRPCPACPVVCPPAPRTEPPAPQPYADCLARERLREEERLRMGHALFECEDALARLGDGGTHAR